MDLLWGCYLNQGRLRKHMSLESLDRMTLAPHACDPSDDRISIKVAFLGLFPLVFVPSLPGFL